MADRIRFAVGRVRVPPELADRLHAVGAARDPVVDDDAGAAGQPGDGIDEVLTPGARICFTVEVVTPDGRSLSREEVNDLAASRGLTPVQNVTKTRCEVLVVAEVGTQSGKARKVQEYGKPVFSAEEFLTWLDRAPAPVG